MKVGSKLPYEELQIKFDFRHGLPTYLRVIAVSFLATIPTSVTFTLQYNIYFCVISSYDSYVSDLHITI